MQFDISEVDLETFLVFDLERYKTEHLVSGTAGLFFCLTGALDLD